MPQLVKGGKYVFGWIKIRAGGELKIPEEALNEYDLKGELKVFILPGSKKSGGFGITSYKKLTDSKLNLILTNNLDLANYNTKKGEMISYRGKKYCWEKIQNGILKLSDDLLKTYGLQIGDVVLSVRGSGLSLGVLTKGPIFEEAQKHSEISMFT
ncbi:MAG: hypothetical protein BAJALOKI1v1_110019 [Promethearchaeota archaeon]|nr:MAG: hypothetical protein BAJALOKI1v1_110019 [Candidatus Lokiarchaeota archaeon]